MARGIEIKYFISFPLSFKPRLSWRFFLQNPCEPPPSLPYGIRLCRHLIPAYEPEVSGIVAVLVLPGDEKKAPFHNPVIDKVFELFSFKRKVLCRPEKSTVAEVALAHGLKSVPFGTTHPLEELVVILCEPVALEAKDHVVVSLDLSRPPHYVDHMVKRRCKSDEEMTLYGPRQKSGGRGDHYRNKQLIFQEISKSHLKYPSLRLRRHLLTALSSSLQRHLSSP